MKKIVIAALAVALVLSVVAITSCGKEEKQEVTTTAATTTEPTTTTEETTKKETWRTLYQSKLDELLDADTVNCGKLIDMNADGTPEMIVFMGQAPSFSTEIFTIEGKKVESVYEKSFTGLRYWQSDASYEVWINESISPTTLVLFDSSDEWAEDKVYAVSMTGDAVSVETLQAKAKGEPDDPDWSNCKCYINDGSVSAGEYEVERDRLQTGADIMNPASSDLESLQAELAE